MILFRVKNSFLLVRWLLPTELLMLREGERKKNGKNNPHNCTKDDFIGDLQTPKISPTLLLIIIETSVFTSH